jgi:hypothetical protein
MSKCAKCQRPIPDQALVCPYCRASVKELSEAERFNRKVLSYFYTGGSAAAVLGLLLGALAQYMNFNLVPKNFILPQFAIIAFVFTGLAWPVIYWLVKKNILK